MACERESYAEPRVERAVAPGSGQSGPALTPPPRGALNAAHVNRLVSLGELTASLFHQVNGVLAYLILNIELLERRLQDSPSLEAIHALRSGAEILRQLVRDTALLARGSTVGRTAVDLSSVVNAALRITGARVGSVANVVEDLRDSPPVAGDETQLLQVVVNALLNAADACEASAGRRTVRISLGTTECGDAVIVVTDDADGLAPEHAARVFEPFFTTKPSGKGTGLGLSLARTIVEGAGGRITFDSARGVGASLRVVLPASPAGP